jgi:hypothetical protein
MRTGTNGATMQNRAWSCLYVLLMISVSAPGGRVLAQGGGDRDKDDPDAQLDKVRQRVLTQGKACPDPDRPCDGFKGNELSFKLARPFNFDRGQDRSQPFYAVILKSAALCGIAEDERLRVQSLFPRNKVFLHRYFCEDFGDKVTYTNVNPKLGFIAVHAGDTEAEAKAFLARVQAGGQFPGANLRKMQVVITWQLE